ncbi:MAG: hypothetical protein Q6K80_05860 [Thermostichus sp. DG_1_6_bins_120]
MPQSRPTRIPTSLARQRALQIAFQQRSQAINRRSKPIHYKTHLLYRRNLPLYLRNLLCQYRASFIYNLKAKPVSRLP